MVTYFVEDIMDARTALDGSRIEYMIKWEGYKHSKNTWEPETDLDPYFVNQFWQDFKFINPDLYATWILMHM